MILPYTVAHYNNNSFGVTISCMTAFMLSLFKPLPQIIIFAKSDIAADKLKPQIQNPENTFDFIVVGGGSAGAVVANRLSENFTVLLLEAGGEPSPLSTIPVYTLPLLNQPYVDWRFRTIPQKNACFAMNHQISFQSRGLGLGGSSNLNFMIYMRGNPKDFDNWANITEDSRWSYEKVLTFFKKSEDFTGKYDDANNHSHGGNLKVAETVYGELGDFFVQSGVDMGFEEGDLNARTPHNKFSKIYYTMEKGKRCGTFQSFITPVRKRKNLTIYKFSQAYKILFKDPDNMAYGVEYERHGIIRLALAQKEIIVSAGTFMTPHLLMHSGVGPKAHLEFHKIPVRVDLPVGKNYQDHITGFIGPFITEYKKSILVDRDLNIETAKEFLTKGTGPFSSTGVQASAFLVSTLAKAKGQFDWPDIQFFLSGLAMHNNSAKDFSYNFNVPEATFKTFYSQALGRDSFMIINVLSRPKQRGEIILGSSNPKHHPIINPNYLSEPEDMKVLIEGAHLALKLVKNSSVFQAINATLSSIPFPGCENLQFLSDDYWECFHRHFSLTLYDPVGTCAMGKKDSKEAVVDSQLRVLGTKRLRVIDASIMPTITSGNTNIPTIMIGEVGADLIKSTWSSNAKYSW